MNQTTEEVNASLMEAFWTILIIEHRHSYLSLAQWARDSRVELRSLKMLTDLCRAVRCEYAIRLCCGLRLSFPRVLHEAIELKLRTPKGKRCAWRSRLLEDLSARDVISAEDSGAIAASVCAALARRITDSGRSFSELARESGVERTVISRLDKPGRQNPSLQSLFDLSVVVGCSLDVLATEALAAFQKSKKQTIK